MKASEIEVGKTYHFKGGLFNGYKSDGVTPNITKEDVVRKVVRITEAYIVCECGRKFVKNDNLIVEPWNY